MPLIIKLTHADLERDLWHQIGENVKICVSLNTKGHLVLLIDAPKGMNITRNINKRKEEHEAKTFK